ncbi:MAG: acetylornithine transaminase [Lachnospiraceae bacterium]|nr:acetylornithine transaminase [Lachnospiraceae bacterium]
MDTFERDTKYVAGTYKRFPVEIVSGQGSIMTGSDGKKYIDLGSGIGVTAFGIGDEEYKKAVISQLDMVQHTSNLYYSKPCTELAKVLCERTGMKKVFFSNSGAEANECAIKVLRKYAAEKKGEDCYTIITLKNSFHGRTITTLSATGQDKFHELFKPMTPGFIHVTAGDFEEFKNVCENNKIAGFMIECVQGEGGVVPVDADYIKKTAEYCAQHDILLAVDEVQTGNGRTGKLYSYMNFGITPDVVTTAKGLAGGLPIGVCMMGSKVENIFSYGDNGSTFGGNPISCSAALSIINRIDDKLLDEVVEKSKMVREILSGSEGIEGVTGLGLMLGIKTKKPAGEVIATCIENGVLCLAAKDKVRLLPALNIPKDVLREAVEIIKRCSK